MPATHTRLGHTRSCLGLNIFYCIYKHTNGLGRKLIRAYRVPFQSNNIHMTEIKKMRKKKHIHTKICEQAGEREREREKRDRERERCRGGPF